MTVIDLVTGFLGAGKTTFILQYADWLEKKGQRVVVVENEFGAAGIDGAIIKRRSRNVKELSGGCICCGMKVGFYSLLRELVSSGEWDRVIIEPSGIFSLDDYFDVTESREIAENGECGAVVTVMDAGLIDTYDGTLREMFFSQLHSASAVLVSKAEVFDMKKYAETVSGILSDFNVHRDIPVLQAPYGGGGEDVFETISRQRSKRREHVRRQYDHMNVFNCVGMRFAEEFDRAELEKRLLQVFDGSCGDVMRVKGHVRLKDGNFAVINGTPGHVQIIEEPDPGGIIVNIIGKNVKRTKLKELFC